MTFRQLLELKNIIYERSTFSSSLINWYESVLDKPIDTFNEGDLSRSLRQKMYPEYILPNALDFLETNPKAEDLDDGGILRYLAELPAEFWHSHTILMAKFIIAAKRGLTRLDKVYDSESCTIIEKALQLLEEQ